MVQQKYTLVPNTFVWIILATTSLAWTSMVQIVMIFILSPALRFPRSREIRAFSRAICQRTEIMDIEMMPSFAHLSVTPGLAERLRPAPGQVEMMPTCFLL